MVPRDRSPAPKEDRNRALLGPKTLAFVLALAALGITHWDRARLGHRHASATGEVVHHHHAHLGAHFHLGDPAGEPEAGTPASGKPNAGESAPASDETPEDSREEPTGVSLASTPLPSLDHGTVALEAPAVAVDRADAPIPPRPVLAARHEPAIPRGPPRA